MKTSTSFGGPGLRAVLLMVLAGALAFLLAISAPPSLLVRAGTLDLRRTEGAPGASLRMMT